MSVLSAESLERIGREVAKYPADQKQSAVMGALAIAQDQHGWLADEVIEAVAKVLGMPPVAVYEVATFYNMYNLKPVGRHKVTVCTNLPCALSGGVDAARPWPHVRAGKPTWRWAPENPTRCCASAAQRSSMAVSG